MQVSGACENGGLMSIIDQTMGSCPGECVMKFMMLALRCSQDMTKDRPSMLEVVRELENISSMLMPPQSEESSIPCVSGTSSVYFGSGLVSGVIPTIRPR